jgi:ketosteroid isomerase-like protein
MIRRKVLTCFQATGAVVLLMSLSSLLAAETPAPVAEVAKLEDARRAAMISADPAALENVFAADCTYIHSNGISQSRADLLGMLARGEIRYRAFTVEAVQYRAYGSTVVVTGMQTIELTNSGKPFASRSRYTVVYAPAAGGLQVVAYQSTPLPDVVMQEKHE